MRYWLQGTRGTAYRKRVPLSVDAEFAWCLRADHAVPSCNALGAQAPLDLGCWGRADFGPDYYLAVYALDYDCLLAR